MLRKTLLRLLVALFLATSLGCAMVQERGNDDYYDYREDSRSSEVWIWGIPLWYGPPLFVIEPYN